MKKNDKVNKMFEFNKKDVSCRSNNFIKFYECKFVELYFD